MKEFIRFGVWGRSGVYSGYASGARQGWFIKKIFFKISFFDDVEIRDPHGGEF